MKRVLLPFVALVVLASVACGGGDKKSPAPTQAPEATATTAPSASSSPSSADAGEEAVSSIFNTIFSSGALTRGTNGVDSGALPAGDEFLTQYLLTADDVPSDYVAFGDFTYRLPDGISKDGGMDMAASMFMSGDPAATDPSGSTILMSMVLKPDDLTELGDQLSQAQNLSEDDLRDAIAQGADSLGGMKIANVEVLDVSDLGDGGFGMAMTIDMTELIDAIAAISGEGEDLPDLGTMTMRMYFFASGDYVAGIMRIGFSESLPSDVDEKALAGIVEDRLP